MRMSKGLKIALELVGANNTVDSLALEITDLLTMRDLLHYKLTVPDKLILGLGFSEFLAMEDTEEEYIKAEIKQKEFLKIIGIEYMDLYYAIEKVYGRDGKIA